MGKPLQRIQQIEQLAGRALPLVAKLDAVEAFYARRNQPARYQVCPVAEPAHLDETLEARGYIQEAETAVQVAEVRTVLAETRTRVDHSISIARSPDENWLRTYEESGQLEDRAADVRRDILRRIAARTAHVLASAGQHMAVGLGVLDQEWLGVFCMPSRTGLRRRGGATNVLHALADWGQRCGAKRCYLQVEHRNLAALALYERVGFRTIHDYRFRL